MKVKINESCIGCGMCVTICPNVFKMSDEGVAIVSVENPTNFETEINEAKNSCPVQVIEVTE